MKKDNKILKIGGLIILVFATQLSCMFIYERYIQRSTIQKIIDKQHALRLLYLEYREKNILPKTFITDEQLRLWGQIDICDPLAMYEETILEIQEQIGQCWTSQAREELETVLRNARRNKKELIKFFKQVMSILRS